MKVLHITATHLNKYGGIPVVLEKLVKHQNEIIGTKSLVLSVKNEVAQLKSNFFHFRSDYNEIEEFIKDYNPDVTVFHGLYFIEYVKVMKILSSHKYRYFIQPHSSFMKTAQEKGKIKKYIANNTLFKGLIKNAHGYIFLNQAEMDKSIYRTENDLIIPNGIDANYRELEKSQEEKLKIFFIGRMDINHKGLDLLFQELKKLDGVKRDFSIYFYGVGSQKEIEAVNNYIRQFETLELEYKGPVYGKEKESVFEESNIMILTSRYEGFPITVLEALSYGNPCIVTNGTNVRKMIEANNIGWGTEYDKISETILKAIEDYKNNPASYVKNTRDFVKENYSWSEISKLSIELLSNS
ncbi:MULTISPECIES: glycosyltransferase [Bacillus]|uniref:glycosyltransferase n=1 Tax=Bacillus TaxID=1386 RepID=UPI0006D949CB|nr:MULTISPECIES: glycosyltransferase [Bacillus]ATI62348.1 hypothetical protein CPZ31_26425 [Bacillus cereus]KPU54255.1 glycosyl transferases group 1 family protein [Bacillus wiedmannii]MBJ7950719.1 glycosyltransferase [Bacillus cereus]MBT0789872.1 glycosyltransferase [Bacillus cereus]MBX9157840.1 glycosyltransferase [Bacillus cereus]